VTGAAATPAGDSGEVNLRDVQVRPTRFGLAFLAFVLLTLIGCVNYQLSLGYLLSFLLAGTWGVAAVHALRALPGLSVAVHPPGPVFAGQDASFEVTVTNPTSLAREDVRVRTERGEARLLAPARAAGRAVLIVRTERRGWLRLGPLVLEGQDALGLFRATCPVPGVVEALVYPAPERNAPSLPVATAGVGGRGLRRADGDDYQGLRTYRPGDSPRRVSWRHAAHTEGTLLTKVFDAPATERVLLDWAALPGLGVEARASRLTAWVLAAEQRGAQYGLRLPGTDLPPGRGDAHARRALRALALLDARGNA